MNKIGFFVSVVIFNIAANRNVSINIFTHDYMSTTVCLVVTESPFPKPRGPDLQGLPGSRRSTPETRSGELSDGGRRTRAPGRV